MAKYEYKTGAGFWMRDSDRSSSKAEMFKNIETEEAEGWEFVCEVTRQDLTVSHQAKCFLYRKRIGD